MDDVMEVSRSLGWTLVAAVGSYALLVSTSWKMGLLHGPNSNEPLVGRVMWHAINTFLMPFQAVQHVLNQAMSLQTVLGSYLSKGLPFFPHLEVATAHLTLSSVLLVEAPASQDPGPHLRRFLVPAESLSALRPFELTPVCAYVASFLGGLDAELTQPPPPYEEKLYLHLPAPIFVNNESLQEREALPMCGFSDLDQDTELCTMDERARLSRLRGLAVVLQAGGYALGVAERWKRGLAISPVEAILCVFSVPVLIQVVMQPSAARLNYDRPLLLRLRAFQFIMFRDLPRTQVDRANAYKYGYASKVFLNLAYLGCSFFILPTLTLYYSFHYWHLCRASSLSTLLLLCTFPFFALTFASKYNLSQDFQALIAGRALTNAYTSPLLLFGVGQMCVFSLSITLAFWSTITHWDSFSVPTNPKFAWLLPHLAT